MVFHLGGACWAFSAAGCLESAYSIKYNVTPISLSEGQMIDCTYFTDPYWTTVTPPALNNGCAGGNPLYGLSYANLIGLEKSNDYPFVGVR